MKNIIVFLTALMISGSMFAAVQIPEPATNIYGRLKGNEVVVTNQMAINQAIIANLGSGGGGSQVIYGEGLNNESTCYKATLADVSDTQKVAPTEKTVYLSDESLQATIYGSDLKKMKDPSAGGLSLVEVDGNFKLQGMVNGSLDTWSYTTEVVTGLVLSVVIPEKKTYDYSHPYDWNVFWVALDDPDTTVNEVVNYSTNYVGAVYKHVTRGVIKNNKAKLYINYFDEVNVPNFSLDHYEVVSGPGRIENDVLIATQSGSVTIRAVASDGTSRTLDIPMWSWKDTISETSYVTDAPSTPWALNRKRVNDYHLNMLQRYRTNPTTNYHYTTWNSPTASHHYSNPGDRFTTGEYGRHFHPYLHIGSDNGGSTGFWWSHGPVSKHVLIAAAHYGDYNFNRFLGGTEYFNNDRRVYTGPGAPERTSVKVRKWYYASEWAAAHGFEGTDAQCGDLAFWVVEGEIPDACLPYIASADWINRNYGVDPENYPGTLSLPTVMLTQGMLVSMKAMNPGTCISNLMGPSKGMTWFDDDGNLIRNSNSIRLREDIARLVGLGGWHDDIMGDSGKPSYIYDPAYTTGLKDEEGNDVLRPILLHPTTWAGGGCSGSVAKHCKIVKAFVEWVGDTLPYTLGDIDNQSTDTEIIKKNAIEAMGGVYVPKEQ